MQNHHPPSAVLIPFVFFFCDSERALKLLFFDLTKKMKGRLILPDDDPQESLSFNPERESLALNLGGRNINRMRKEQITNW